MGQERDVLIDGVRLRYRETGPPDAPVILALHASGQSAGTWDELADRLSDRWRILAPDQRGHGSSAHPAEYSFELLRDDAAGFVEALGIAPCVVLGHSMGGTVAILLAETRPDLVRLLVLEDTPPPRRADPPLAFPDTAPAHLSIDPRAWTALICGQLADPDPRWWNDLANIKAPTLILAGGPTSFVPQADLAAAADLIPDAHLFTIDGAGHQVHATRPDEFTTHLTQFLAEHPT